MPKKNGKPYNRELPCVVCGDPVFAKGLCRNHYANERYRLQWGSSAHGLRTYAGGGLCPVPKCEKTVLGGGVLCIGHAQSARRWKMGEDEYAYWRCITSCQSCGNDTQTMHMDHDHSCCKHGCSNCIRGVLCMSCNMALGQLGDNRERILNLAAYIARG